LLIVDLPLPFAPYIKLTLAQFSSFASSFAGYVATFFMIMVFIIVCLLEYDKLQNAINNILLVFYHKKAKQAIYLIRL
jgi:predicted PurR-regulated permease PerM